MAIAALPCVVIPAPGSLMTRAAYGSGRITLVLTITCRGPFSDSGFHRKPNQRLANNLC